MTRLLSLTDTRKALGAIGRTKLYELINGGYLERRYLDGKPVITEQSIEDYIRSLPTGRTSTPEAATGRGVQTAETPEATHDHTPS